MIAYSDCWFGCDFCFELLLSAALHFYFEVMDTFFLFCFWNGIVQGDDQQCHGKKNVIFVVLLFSLFSFDPPDNAEVKCIFCFFVFFII